MKKKKDVPPALLAEHFSYDQETGVLCWTKPTSRRVKVGDTAGCKSGAGYLTVDFKGHKFLVHRLVLALVNREWPKDHVDHINHNPLDNRLCNLRVVGVHGNMHNLSSHKDSHSPFKGASWHKKAKKWTANITRYGKTTYLGLFNNEEDAHKAYKNFEESYHVAQI